MSNGKFTNESLKRKLNVSIEDGQYWATFPINQSRYILAQRDQKPEPTAREILLYGKVTNGKFSSYIFEEEAGLSDGRYWLIIEPDTEQVSYLKSRQLPVDKLPNELLVEGVVDDLGKFTADNDPDFSFSTSQSVGKYFVRFEVNQLIDVLPQENEKPIIEKGEKLLEAYTWVNKETGEIKIDIQKNREDQRHHALDAIVVALSELTYLNQLSHYSGQLKDWERGKEDRPTFDQPWPHFDQTVNNAIEQILVSYAQNKKVVSRISKMINKNGRSFKSVGFAARGRLHREYYFGRHPYPILHQKNPQTGELLFEKDKDGNLQYYYHIRKSVSSLKNNKHIDKIVDEGIKNLICERLEKEFNINTKDSYNIPSDFFL